MRLLALIALLLPLGLLAQESVLSGRVFQTTNNQPLPYTELILSRGDLRLVSQSDSSGNFRLVAPSPGIYNLEARQLGFKPAYLFEIELYPDRPNFRDVGMNEEAVNLKEFSVETSAFEKRDETPLSINRIGVTEIKRNPGANRDISKVIQSLPGVASQPSFRNDLIVRGGSPNENRFYLDDIEVPVINHFSTQGASGGPVGMINVDFLQDVDFLSSSFPANRGNALSSVLNFRYKEGRSDKAAYTFSLGATDLSGTFDGPLSEKTTLIASYRHSYLQFLFDALELPFLPTYDDFQFRLRYKPDLKNEITILGIGAYDVVRLNEIEDPDETQQYILDNIPENTQWNYTLGASWKRYREKGYSTLVLSRNMLSNKAEKYFISTETGVEELNFSYRSDETESKLRLENTHIEGQLRINYGINLEYAQYYNKTFRSLAYNRTVSYEGDLGFLKYGAFGSVSRNFSRSGLVLSAGLRFDGNSHTTDGLNPLSTLSPRISASYPIDDQFSLNAHYGLYYQLPAYTLLGYRNSQGDFLNKDLNYIQNQHFVLGLEYTSLKNRRITLEGFYKPYNDYPFSLSDSISIANLGSDFGVVGDVPADSRSKGRAYGIELLIQQKLYRNFYGILAYTFVSSEFSNLNNELTRASWDYGHILSLTAGYLFGKGWEIGVKYRFNGAAPYTPYDVTASALKSNWDVTRMGITDKTQINTAEAENFQQVDIRIDKKFFFTKWNLELYLDIQNLFNQTTAGAPILTVVTDEAGNPLTDPNNTDSYQVKFLENEDGNLIPTVGFILSF